MDRWIGRMDRLTDRPIDRFLHHKVAQRQPIRPELTKKRPAKIIPQISSSALSGTRRMLHRETTTLFPRSDSE